MISKDFFQEAANLKFSKGRDFSNHIMNIHILCSERVSCSEKPFLDDGIP